MPVLSLAMNNTMKEREKSKVEKKSDAEQEQKLSAADELYREQVDEFNVCFELLLYIFLFFCCCFKSFSALMLLVGWQEGHLACKETEWWDAGMVICQGRSADLHMAQLMPLPLTISCSSKSRLALPCGIGLPG